LIHTHIGGTFAGDDENWCCIQVAASAAGHDAGHDADVKQRRPWLDQ
jgi:hypothetical protein